MPEPSTLDKLLELVNPLPKQAEAAPWEVTAKLLRQMSKGLKAGEMSALKPEVLAEMAELGGRKPSASRYALERLTEEFPAVNRVPLFNSAEFNPYTGKPMGKGSFWQPPRTSSTIDAWLKAEPSGKMYFDPGSAYVAPATVHSPWGAYAHEGSHVFGGPLWQWTKKGEIPELLTPTRAAMEGYAIGSEAGLMDKFNRLAPRTAYWSKHYKGTPLQEPFVKAGELGVRSGADIREGKKVSQQNIIEQLVDLINSFTR